MGDIYCKRDGISKTVREIYSIYFSRHITYFLVLLFLLLVQTISRFGLHYFTFSVVPGHKLCSLCSDQLRTVYDNKE